MTRLTNINIDKNSITLIAMSIIVMLSTTSAANVFATHYYSGQKWSGTSIETCYSTNLSNLTINGQIGQFNTVAAQIDGARNDWNDEPSVWSFTKVSSCTHIISAASLGSSGAIATTSTTPSNPLTDADTSINWDYTYTTTNTCSMPPYYLQYIMTHELGHWLRLVHSTDPPAQTVMYAVANCAGTTVKSHDSSTLTSIYG